MSSSDALTEATAAALGSVVALVLTYPLKTIYTLQAVKSNAPKQDKITAAQRALKGVFPNTQWANTLLGYHKLYAGFKPAVVETAVSQGVYFYLYSFLRQLAVAQQQKALQKDGSSKNSKDISIGVGPSLMIAALAGAGNTFITTPAQVVTTRMQASNSSEVTNAPTDVWETIANINREQGLAGFWQGLSPSLVLVVNPAIQYMLYETLLRTWRKWRVNGKLSAADIFLISAQAKLGATIVTYPMIVVKSRLQAMSKDTDHDRCYSGTVDAIQRIFTTEGLGGFFKGLNAKIVQTVLNAALLMMLKEQIYSATKRMLKR